MDERPPHPEVRLRRSRHGFAYARKRGEPDGIDRLTLTEGLLDGRAKITVHAKGARFTLPSLPLATPLRIQLRNAGGMCWEAIVSSATKNDGRRFKARSE